MICQKSTLILSSLFPTGLYPFQKKWILVLVCHILSLTVTRRLSESHGGVRVIGVASVPLVLAGIC